MTSQKEKDLAFLKEMHERFLETRKGDVTQLDFVERMILDWIAELEDK